MTCNLEPIAQALREASSITIAPHENPDADAIGSSLGLALALQELGKDVTVVTFGQFPPSLCRLPGGEQLVGQADAPMRGDALVILDTGVLNRAIEQPAQVGNFSTVINIDHHTGNEEFTELRHIDVTASASGVLVFKLLKLMELPVTEAIATNLYAALMTDTGKFSYSNTNAEALHTAMELFQAGAHPHHVNTLLYEAEPLKNLRVRGLCLQRANVDVHEGLVATWLSKEDLAEYDASPENTEGIVEMIRNYENTVIAAFLREDPKGIKVSLRSREPLDVAAFAREHGGGGHVRAAGFRVSDYGDFGEAVDDVLERLRQLIVEHEASA